jgi:hypothetical protein
MIAKLSQRDRRALKLAAVAIVAIMVYLFAAAPWIDNWRLTAGELKRQRAELKSIISNSSGAGAAKQAGLAAIVAKLEMPQKENIQQPLFREKINEQLKKAGIEVKSLKYLTKKAPKAEGGYKTKLLECRGKAKFGQILDLLASFTDNPYLFGIEDIQLQCDTKDRNKPMDLVLIVSTFVK